MGAVNVGPPHATSVASVMAHHQAESDRRILITSTVQHTISGTPRYPTDCHDFDADEASTASRICCTFSPSVKLGDTSVSSTIALKNS